MIFMCSPQDTQLETINKYNKHSRQIGTENMHPWKEKNMNTQCPPFVQFARENASGYQFIGKWLSFSKVKKFMTLWTKKNKDRSFLTTILPLIFSAPLFNCSNINKFSKHFVTWFSWWVMNKTNVCHICSIFRPIREVTRLKPLWKHPSNKNLPHRL